MRSVEHELLAHAIADKKVLSTLMNKGVEPDLFVQEAGGTFNRTRALYTIIQTHYKQYHDVLTKVYLDHYIETSELEQEFKSALLTAYTEVALTKRETSVDFLLDKLRHQYKKEKIRRSLLQQQALFNQDKLDDLLKGGISDYCNVMSSTTEDIEEGSILDHLEVRRAQYMTPVTGGVKTGFETLDRASMGGLQGGRFHYIASGTSEGKSTLLTNISFNSWRFFKNDVLIISAEDYLADLRMKLDTIATGISSRIMREGSLSGEELNRFDKEMAEQQKLKDICSLQLIGVQGSCTPSFIESKLVENLQHMPDLVVVDYLQELESDKIKKNNNSSDYYGDIVKELRRIARKYHIPIFTASQISRTGWKDNRKEKKEFYDSYSDGQSQQVANKADMRLSLRAIDTESFDSHIVDLEARITKNRAGPKSKFIIRTNFATGKMVEVRDLQPPMPTPQPVANAEDDDDGLGL